MKSIMLALLLATFAAVAWSALMNRKDIKTTYRVCQHHCDKDLAYCILTCDNELKMENDVNVCEHTCHTYKEYCVAHCFN
ncbi:hypothetical protein LSAT2_018069 [Lamellibrachia satsuma]|nr:hypothetical protein LSAT2_018069 [Lamellibrachia satsuma]